MKPQTTQSQHKGWGLSHWINIAIAVLSALVGAIGTQAANVVHIS